MVTLIAGHLHSSGIYGQIPLKLHYNGQKDMGFDDIGLCPQGIGQIVGSTKPF